MLGVDGGKLNTDASHGRAVGLTRHLPHATLLNREALRHLHSWMHLAGEDQRPSNLGFCVIEKPDSVHCNIDLVASGESQTNLSHRRF